MEQPSGFTLKVNVNCCKGCPYKATKKLQKMAGVESFTFDMENRLVAITGTVDPTVVIKMFKKLGRKAELLPVQLEMESAVENDDLDKCSACLDYDDDDDDDDDDIDIDVDDDARSHRSNSSTFSKNSSRSQASNQSKLKTGVRNMFSRKK